MTLLRITVFSLVVLLSYTLFANILPQVQSDPPEEEEVDVAALDQAGQIAWGERLFHGKGTCTLCHNSLGRAPDLLAMDLAAAIEERLADPRYAGEAEGAAGAGAAEVYLRESLLLPSAYVVAGFGKKGTNDAVSPMPKVDGAPVSLGEDEMNAVIAFLQDKAGLEVTVALPSETADIAQTEPEAEEEVEEAGPATDPETVIDNLGCAGCHDLLESGADIGPALTALGERMDRAEIRRAILDPNAEVAEGYESDFMPQDYGEQMWVSELELLIDYLEILPPAEQAQ